jgi:hypothetical protein
LTRAQAALLQRVLEGKCTVAADVALFNAGINWYLPAVVKINCVATLTQVQAACSLGDAALRIILRGVAARQVPVPFGCAT